MSEQTNLLPALDASTAVALRDSIEMHGVVVPVVVDQHGRIIDGHHRSRIADDLGITYIKRSMEVADEDEFRRLSVELNTIRRHMPIEERQRIVAELRALGHSVRAIAGTVGAPKSTVADDLKVSGTGHVPVEVVGTDGKRYPATRPAPEDVAPETIPGQTAIPVPATPPAKPVSPLLDPTATPKAIAAENERTHRYSATQLVVRAISPLRHHPATREHALETVELLDASYLRPGDDISPEAARHVASVLTLIADALEGATA
jgi:hypothetical protein